MEAKQKVVRLRMNSKMEIRIKSFNHIRFLLHGKGIEV
jgi:hypothetical protein